jgi:hypothetical protein
VPRPRQSRLSAPVPRIAFYSNVTTSNEIRYSCLCSCHDLRTTGVLNGIVSRACANIGQTKGFRTCLGYYEGFPSSSPLIAVDRKILRRVELLLRCAPLECVADVSHWKNLVQRKITPSSFPFTREPRQVPPRVLTPHRLPALLLNQVPDLIPLPALLPALLQAPALVWLEATKKCNPSC